MYFFHNVHNLLKKGSGPYYYLPKVRAYESRSDERRGTLILSIRDVSNAINLTSHLTRCYARRSWRAT